MTERSLITPEQLPAGDLGSAQPAQLQLAGTSQAIADIIADPQRLDAMDKDKLDWMYRTAEAIRRERARLAFEAAFGRVQLQKTPVVKRAVNRQIGNKYAMLEDVVAMLEPVLKDNGFTYRFKTAISEKPEHVRQILVVAHVPSGHTEESGEDVPYDYTGLKGTPNKTKLHGMGSTKRYTQRYALCEYFSVVLVGEDDDGVAGGAGPASEPISENQLLILDRLADFTGINRASFNTVYALGDMKELPKSLYLAARQMMMSKIGMTQAEYLAWLRNERLSE